MPLPTRTVRVSRRDRAALEIWIRSRTTSQRVVERARIVLASSRGMSGFEICARLGVSRPTVSRWLNRFEAEGLQALRVDRPRSGRPKTITPAQEAQIVDKTLHSAPPHGTHWSTRLLARETGLHHASIARIWKIHGLQPHRVEFFKLSRDPQFVAKLRDVVGLYVNPPQRAVVFAFDEKSQIQALDRTQPGLPWKRGRAGTMTHNYKRHGGVGSAR